VDVPDVGAEVSLLLTGADVGADESSVLVGVGNGAEISLLLDGAGVVAGAMIGRISKGMLMLKVKKGSPPLSSRRTLYGCD
jgi:hypothetical protein